MDGAWYDPIVKSLKDQTATWFVGLIIALLSVFSSYIVESLKFAMNRADLRAKNYEELSMDLSEFLFIAELNHEFLEKGWTTRESLMSLVKEYNDSITKVRKKEYVYISWIGQYWGEKHIRNFAILMDLIKAFDRSIHSLNDEFEAVNIKKTQEKVDPEKAKPAITQMGAHLEQLKTHAKTLLIELR